MRAVLIANTEDADPGFIGRSLRQRGYSFTEFLREDHHNWPTLDGFDLVVAMGSNWSTYWDHVAGPVLAEQTLLADAIARGIGILGICFGAQQLAMTLGGDVTRAKTPEIGWYQVFPIAEVADVTPECLTRGRWMQWHYDRFSVPAGATALADSPVGPQAMVCGRALGLQFHPEATESIVRLWMSGEGADELDALAMRAEELADETTARVTEAEQRCDELVAWFLENIAQRHMA
ncbi:MAG: gamma-glutamyl-gamma-aminobutyrate hydrolase family protein [Actinomycetota bacterium]